MAIKIEDVRLRLQRDNPWWVTHNYVTPEFALKRRVYFEPFQKLALDFRVRRATVLLGPRRVGKTVMLKQLISELIASGFAPSCILLASIDTPVYSGMSLEQFLQLMPSNSGDVSRRRVVIFDEIQYLQDWERHLKDLVDQHPETKFVATGSAAAALRLKSRESGAGRFSEFMLPPLTFHEFLRFQDLDEKLIEETEGHDYRARDIEALNESFIDYLNFGGYPEAVLNQTIRGNPDQFIKNDIIDKVLLKDLPVLYGIADIVALNRLFSFLAYNAGQEASLDKISQQSGLTKPTVTKYITYLESAFLIIKMATVDENCRSLKRERNFKIFLNNPSMRAALFAPVTRDETAKIGHLAESAVFSQWQHASNFRQLRYARWKNEGEVDIVYLSHADDRPVWIGEIKWSDRVSTHEAEETKGLRNLIQRHDSVQSAFITTRTVTRKFLVDGSRVPMEALPTALHCYRVGRNITSSLTISGSLGAEAGTSTQIRLFVDVTNPREA